MPTTYFKPNNDSDCLKYANERGSGFGASNLENGRIGWREAYLSLSKTEVISVLRQSINALLKPSMLFERPAPGGDTL